MAKAVRVGDIGTDHDGYPPTPVISGSPDVIFDGIPAARVGDPLQPHDKPHGTLHPRTIVSGASTVFINGKPAAITGGQINCGGVTIGGGTVEIGDEFNTASAVAAAKKVLNFDEQVRVIAPEGKPLANTPYFIEKADGTTLEGITGEDGLLPRITTEQKDKIKVLLGVKALERWAING